jgi:NAD-dependent SIR2 family protein deacetylase
LAKEFLDTRKFKATPTHHFIKLLQDKGVLQLNLSQNIDNLEAQTGLNMEEKVV